MLMDSDTDFEFRTTVVRGLHSAEDFADIAAWLLGNEKYFLQAFKDSGDVISGGCAAFTREEMESFRAILLPAIPNAEIRGMDRSPSPQYMPPPRRFWGGGTIFSGKRNK